MSQNQNSRNQKNQNRVQVNAGNGKNCEQIEVTFAEKAVDGSKRMISYLGDGTVVYPGTRRFHPKAGTKYLCSVKFVGRGGKVGLAKPVLPYTLSPSEWVATSELRTCCVSTLMFRKNTRMVDGKQVERLIAWDNGQAVFPDDGVEMPVEKPVTCLLREAGTVAFALPLTVEAQTSQKGLVKLAEIANEASLRDLAFVVVRDTVVKSGTVGAPRSEGDVEEIKRYRNIYDILGVKDGATIDEIRRAFKTKAPAVHPDRVLQAFGGKDRAPILVRKNAENYFEALNEAHERALDIIERREQKSRVRSEAKPQATVAKVTTPAVKIEAPKPVAKPTPVAETKPAQDSAEEVAEKLVAAVMGVGSTSELRDESKDAASEAKTKAPKKAKVETKKDASAMTPVEKFQAKYGDKAKSATTAPKKAKVETKPVEEMGQKSLGEQLKSLKLGQ